MRALALAVLIVAGIMVVRNTSLGELASAEHLAAALIRIREVWWAPGALFALYAVLTPLGVSAVPLLVAGAVFGPFLGTIYNTTGLIFAAVASYWLARVLGRDFVAQIAGAKFRRAEWVADKHGFWPLVQASFLPVPAPVVNFGAALAGVKPVRFLLARAVGLIPSTFIHSFFIWNLMVAQGRERLYYGIAYGGSFVIVNLLIGIPWLLAQIRRKARYEALTAARARRAMEIDG